MKNCTVESKEANIVACRAGTVFKEKFQRCGSTCETYKTSALCEASEARPGCACPGDQVFNDDVRRFIFH